MKLKNIILLGTAAVAFTACDDLFEPAIENNHDITDMYSDPQFARGIIDNAFLVLPYEENPTNMTDLGTDNAVSNDYDNTYKRMASGAWKSDNDPVSQWNTRYHAIQYCNLFLENCDQVEWDYSSEALKQMHNDLYKGQAYAIRGLQFFYLLRAHAGKVNGELMGVPIHTSSEDGSSDFNKGRDSFKDCIDQIISDFDEALKYLPMEYGDITGAVPAKYAQMGGKDSEYNRAFGDMQRGKIDGKMIAAFKAQVALFAASPAYSSANAMSWEDAARYAVLSLNNAGGLGGMDPEGWHWFDNTGKWIDNFGFTDPDPQEICWRGVVGMNSSYESSNYPPSLYGTGRVNPTQNLVDAFPMANGLPISAPNSGYDVDNPYENRDPRLTSYILVHNGKCGARGQKISTAVNNEKNSDGLDRESGLSTRTGYYLRKLLRSDLNLNASNADKKHFGARIRYTEIFLDYAEAANEASGPKTAVGGANYSAYDVIKAIRQRAGVGVDSDPYLEECATSKEKMRELIHNERRLELCFENHRFWDLRRWNEMSKLNEPIKGMRVTQTDEKGATGPGSYEVFTLPDEPRNYQDYMVYGPIPYSEILKWSNLLQNDGWK